MNLCIYSNAQRQRMHLFERPTPRGGFFSTGHAESRQNDALEAGLSRFSFGFFMYYMKASFGTPNICSINICNFPDQSRIEGHAEVKRMWPYAVVKWVQFCEWKLL